jgi:hypothetical protein
MLVQRDGQVALVCEGSLESLAQSVPAGLEHAAAAAASYQPQICKVSQLPPFP